MKRQWSWVFLDLTLWFLAMGFAAFNEVPLTHLLIGGLIGLSSAWFGHDAFGAPA